MKVPSPRIEPASEEVVHKGLLQLTPMGQYIEMGSFERLHALENGRDILLPAEGG